MSDVEVRAARDDDLDAVGALTYRAYLADGYLSEALVASGYASELADASIRMRDTELLVALDRTGELVGTVAVVLPGTRYAEISRDGELEFRMLAVAPAARGRGVGEALTRAVIDRGRLLGAHRVVLCTRPDMPTPHRLYRRLGFVRMPERDWVAEGGTPLIAFGLTLSDRDSG